MAILTVGPNSTYANITAAMVAAVAGVDEIQLETGYTNDTATVTKNNITISGDATSTGIVLQLAVGIAIVTLTGTAPINIVDASVLADGNAIVGNDGDNVITITAGADTVTGGAGNDRLVVDYSLATGAITGNSTSNFAEAGGGARLATIVGGFEHFTIRTGIEADTITTGAGDDIINTGEGASTVNAGAGANMITGGSGADTVTVLGGGSIIDVGNGANTVTSGSGNDIITSGVDTDTITSGGGADLITVRGGADTVHAEAGDDRLVVDYSAFGTGVTGGVTGGNVATGYTGHIADLAGNTVDFDGTENITITTGSGNDNITTGDGIDVLNGGAGNDQLNGGGGNDNFTGGAGNDLMDGGAGTDTAHYSGQRSDYTITVLSPNSFQVVDNRVGSPDGTDILTNFELTQFGDSVLLNASVAENTSGVSMVAAANPTGPVTYAIAGGGDGALFVVNATTGKLDFIKSPDFEKPGDANHNNTYDVTVSATYGATVEMITTLVTVTDMLGNIIIGSATKDIVDATHTVAGQLMVTPESDHILGLGGKDALSGLDGDDIVVGGKGRDTLFGNDGADDLKGNKGRDSMSGDDGKDLINGGLDKDKLFGGDGADTLVGGGGKDQLTGGAGDDNFVFKANPSPFFDVVKDFSHGDVVVLDHSSFKHLGLGQVSQAEFNKYFDYDHRELSYDRDGPNGADPVHFATFADNPHIGAADLFVV